MAKAMPKKYSISYREAREPITAPVTKFGGAPVWLDTPCWPLSRLYGSPMQFICQIALDRAIFGDLPARMAYLFITDYDYNGDGPMPDTYDPEKGESALILQPGGKAYTPALPLYEGSALYRRYHRNGRWEQEPCELAVDLRLGDDPEAGAWDKVDSDDKEAWDAYFEALCEDKVGGTPTPTINNVEELPTQMDNWLLALQLNAKDNEGNDDPFFLNLAYDGVGYALLSPDGRSGKFLWSR